MHRPQIDGEPINLLTFPFSSPMNSYSPSVIILRVFYSLVNKLLAQHFSSSFRSSSHLISFPSLLTAHLFSFRIFSLSPPSPVAILPTLPTFPFLLKSATIHLCCLSKTHPDNHLHPTPKRKKKKKKRT